MTQAAVGTHRAREYETIYVLRPDVDPDGAERVATRVAEVVEREKGKLVKVETWGRRRLAYPVNKQTRGVYFYLKYLGKGGLVAELERNLRMIDTVMKFQTVLLRDEVVIDSVEVDPEEIKFTRLEPFTDEDDREDSPERALGLVESEAPPPSSEPEPAADETEEAAAAAEAGEQEEEK